MNPRPLLAALGLAVFTLVCARLLPLAPAIALSVAAGLAVGVLADLSAAARAGRLAGRIGRWLRTDEYTPVPPGGGPGWRELRATLDELGAEFQRRGERIARERPWRRELVDSLGQPALLFAGDGRLLGANRPAHDLLGIPQRPGELTVIQAVGSPALAEAVHEARLSRLPVTIEAQHRGH